MAGKYKPLKRWPLLLIAAPAAVAVWSGWVSLGELCGFGVVHPLPGIMDSFRLNTAITLPIGIEAYGAFALGAWLHEGLPPRARTFAKRTAVTSLLVGMAGQMTYHLLAAAHATRAPWPVTALVACLPVTVLGLAAALSHLARAEVDDEQWEAEAAAAEVAAEVAAAVPEQPAPEVPAATPLPIPTEMPTPQVAAQARREFASALVQERPELLENGADLGRVLGMSERTGQRLAKQIRSVRPELAPDSV